MESRILFHLGNFLIFASFVLFFIIFLPLYSVYFSQAKLPDKKNIASFSIIIPKIHAYSPIIPEVNPWDPAVYKLALLRGVAHAKGTALPGQNGTMYLFAHSSMYPWEITRTNSAFLRLGELQVNDRIDIYRNGKVFIYLVKKKKVVWPGDISYLLHTNKNQLILQTCTPIGTDLQRLLVFADEKK